MKELPVIHGAPQVKSPSRDGRIVGIDLGTTNSLVAIVENQVPKILRTQDGQALVPSAVRVLDDGTIEVGQKARAMRVRDVEHTVYSVKRLLGRGLKDLEAVRKLLPLNLDESSEKSIQIKVGDRSFSAIEFSSMILKELKHVAEDGLGQPVTNVVITVPAYFNDSQRHDTRTAARLAGLTPLRILNEPTAAALAYGLQSKRNGLIAVYDFGGGTFDISILKLTDGIFEVLATNGDTLLGGDDMDYRVAKWILSTGLPTKDFDKLGREPQAVLLEAAEQLKIALSSKEATEAIVALPGEKKFTVKLDRKTFKSLVLELLERTRPPVEQSLKDAEIERSDLTDVLLVGGPTRLPLVREFVSGLFGQEPNTSVNPDEAVAMGAAIQADILAGNNTEFLLLDVVPLSLGIETFGGVMSKLITRNSRIPAMAREQFTTYVEGQTKIAINVYQGERELVSDNRKIGEFVLSDVPPLPAGVARVEVTFLVDADGILNVVAREVYSGVEQSIEVKPSYGLTEDEVLRMLEAGMENREKDHQARLLVEAKNELRTILSATERSIPLANGELSKEEKTKLGALVEKAKKALDSTWINDVQLAKEELNHGTVHLAEVVMKKTLSEKLVNKKASDFAE